MAYCSSDDVLLRAGRFAPAFSVSGARPNATDITTVIDDVAADIDAAIRGHGFDPTAIDSSVADALEDLNAWAALARVLPQANLGRQAAELLATAQAIADLAFGTAQHPGGSLAAGSHPAIAQLMAGLGGETPILGGDFWSDEPDYGTVQSLADQRVADNAGNMAPRFTRGQSL